MITAHELEKRYGHRRALRAVSFEVAEGGFLAVTGPNGAGKTTLLRMLVGLASPTRGTIEVAATRRRIGFLGHEPLVYGELTGFENLLLYADLYRLTRRRELATAALARVGLGDVASERARSYSRGMTQRLALARALLHEPQLVVLDEPHTALDTEGAGLVDGVLAELRRSATVVVATHDPDRIVDLATARLELAA